MLKKIAVCALSGFVLGGKMKKALLFAVCLAVMGSMGLQATLITIINPSFESDVLAPGGFTTNTFGAGWTCTGVCGAFYPQAAQFAGGAPDGHNVAYANSGTISETLSTNLASNTTYTLTLDVGRRLDAPGFPGYTVELLAGSTIIASDSSLNPAAGTFAVSTSMYTSGSSDPLAGQALSIKLISSGAQTNFDAVALDGSASVPEPATLGLMVGGLPLLLFLRRRRNLNR